MSFNEEITAFQLNGFKLLSLDNSKNSFFTSTMEESVSKSSGDISIQEEGVSAFAQINTDFPRTKIKISRKLVTEKNAEEKLRNLAGIEAEKIALAYSQHLAELAIMPLSEGQKEHFSKSLFAANLFKTSSNQFYLAICYNGFKARGPRDNFPENQFAFEIPGEILYVYAYNPKDNKFHVKFPLASNDLLKELYETDIKIRSNNSHKVQPKLKEKADALKKSKRKKISSSQLLAKIQQALIRQELYVAIQSANLTEVKDLCKNKLTQASLNKAWTIASNAGNKDAADFLMKKGAKIHKKTAFFFSAEKSDAVLMRKLLRTNSIDINTATKTSGNTALHFASRDESLEPMKYLLAHGAHINQANRQGNTALHLAFQNGNLNAVQLLLQKGADINLKNHQGQTPFKIYQLISDPKLNCFVEHYQNGDNAKLAPKIYSLFNDIRALPYQYTGTNKQRTGTIKVLLEHVNAAELNFNASSEPYDKILQTLKDQIHKELKTVTEDHQKSSFAFFRLIKQMTKSRLVTLLQELQLTHKIEPSQCNVSVIANANSEASAPSPR